MRTPFVFSFGRHLEPCLILGSVLGLCGRGAWITACAVFFSPFYFLFCILWYVINCHIRFGKRPAPLVSVSFSDCMPFVLSHFFLNIDFFGLVLDL